MSLMKPVLRGIQNARAANVVKGWEWFSTCQINVGQLKFRKMSVSSSFCLRVYFG